MLSADNLEFSQPTPSACVLANLKRTIPLENITDLKSTCRLLRARLRAREREFATEQARRGPFSQAVKAELNRRQEPVREVTQGLQRSRDQEIDLGP